MVGQNLPQAFNETVLLQLSGTNVDANRNIQSGCVPEFHLHQGTINNPFADFDCQRMIFDDWQKHGGRQQPAFRMLPAN